jgi:osmotically-inducible protein OsmY
VFTLIRLAFLPVRLLLGTAKIGVKTGYRSGRLVGYRRLTVLAAGVGIGVLVAPATGAQTRARLLALLEGARPADEGGLAEKVRYELLNSPRTWHLPQPSVEVVGRAAVLRGTVPHETGRADLERTAAAVPGVASVDNRIEVGVIGTNGNPADV